MRKGMTPLYHAMMNSSWQIPIFEKLYWQEFNTTEFYKIEQYHKWFTLETSILV